MMNNVPGTLNSGDTAQIGDSLAGKEEKCFGLF